MIMRGGKSEVLRDKDADRMLQEFPNATLVDISEAGHTVPEDRTEDVLAAIEPFLAS